MEEQNNLISSDGNYLNPAVTEIRELLNQSRKNVATQVNQALLSTYWRIGEIVLFDLSNFPDGVWKIVVVALLRAYDDF